jgi:ATP adenylyltransferase
MEHIWSPWRMTYLENGANPAECPFCLALKGPTPEDAYVVKVRKKAFVILNRYPYTTGHLLILPLVHKEKLSELDAATRAELMELINHGLEVLGRVYSPEGFNVGMNMGGAAGAGIPKHLHWHIVPRWSGDTNYMTAVGGVRVLPELLADTFQKINAAW